ncbi:hypothetical protein IWW48_003341 [Coemansia sp. RSA 1200]|nr:hypothetical protein IWW48_003341 [Coemansia sp. RSA 1200]
MTAERRMSGGGGSVVVTSPAQKKPEVVGADRVASSSESSALTAKEHESLISEAEWGFRTWLRETSPPSGFVMYPSTRQILKSLNTLHDVLEDVDLSDIAL